MPDPISVFVCDPQPIVIEGVTRVFENCADVTLVGSAVNPTDALEALRTLQPRVALVDQESGRKAALQFLEDSRAVAPDSRVILWIDEISEIECFRALQAGARGVLKKTLPVDLLLECVRRVADGNLWVEQAMSDQMADYMNRKTTPHLTPREKEIVRYVCSGMRNREIATRMGITAGTVKVHLMHIFEKTGVKDRFELAVHGRRLASPEP